CADLPLGCFRQAPCWRLRSPANSNPAPWYWPAARARCCLLRWHWRGSPARRCPALLSQHRPQPHRPRTPRIRSLPPPEASCHPRPARTHPPPPPAPKPPRRRPTSPAAALPPCPCPSPSPTPMQLRHHARHSRSCGKCGSLTRPLRILMAKMALAARRCRAAELRDNDSGCVHPALCARAFLLRCRKRLNLPLTAYILTDTHRSFFVRQVTRRPPAPQAFFRFPLSFNDLLHEQ